MSTHGNIAFWSCLIISNIWSSSNHTIPAFMWIFGAIIVAVVERWRK